MNYSGLVAPRGNWILLVLFSGWISFFPSVPKDQWHFPNTAVVFWHMPVDTQCIRSPTLTRNVFCLFSCWVLHLHMSPWPCTNMGWDELSQTTPWPCWNSSRHHKTIICLLVDPLQTPLKEIISLWEKFINFCLTHLSLNINRIRWFYKNLRVTTSTMQEVSKHQKWSCWGWFKPISTHS